MIGFRYAPMETKHNADGNLGCRRWAFIVLQIIAHHIVSVGNEHPVKALCQNLMHFSSCYPAGGPFSLVLDDLTVILKHCLSVCSEEQEWHISRYALLIVCNLLNFIASLKVFKI